MTKRCFIAINLPKEATWQVQTLLAELEELNSDPVVKFVDFKQIHITLHFLGNLEAEQINQIKKILNNLTADFQPTELKTTKVGGFPNLNQPKVVYLGIDEAKSNSLISLREKLGKELEKIGIDIDHRQWQPHLTLARIKAPIKFNVTGIEPLELSISVKSVELMESRLKPRVAEHAVIESFKLSK